MDTVILPVVDLGYIWLLLVYIHKVFYREHKSPV